MEQRVSAGTTHTANWLVAICAIVATTYKALMQTHPKWIVLSAIMKVVVVVGGVGVRF